MIKVDANNTYVYAYGRGSTVAYHGGLQRGVFKSELPGPDTVNPDPYIENLCTGTGEGRDTGRTSCPKESYQGDV